MEVEIISEECIKPSSPTPLHLKNHKLSFLDMMFGASYVTVVLYYLTDRNTNLSPSDIVFKRLQVLKQSLSETLSIFYPIAGKVKDSYSIDCNDEGAYFVEAKVKSPLNEFLSNPNMSMINKFLPDKGKGKSIPGDYVACIQVTTFDCGGIVVGVCVSHTIADGVAFGSFLKSWAVIARKSTEEVVSPKFDTSSLFPYNDAFPKEVNSNVPESSQSILGRCITRRYLFDTSAIAKLKAKAISSCKQNATRVELVTALFVKFFKARRFESGKPLIITHGVNLRRSAIPQLSEYNMGNIIWIASVLCKDKEVELGDFVCQMKKALAKLDGDFVNSLQGEEGWLNYLKALKSFNELFTDPVNVIGCSSWRNFGFYDVDFGWGKPIWASLADLAELGRQMGLFNIRGIGLMDTRHNDGIEAWVCCLEEEVAMLEHDKEFLAYATINPSPLTISVSQTVTE